MTVRNFMYRYAGSKRNIREKLINVAGAAGAKHPLSAAQMAVIHCGVSTALTAAIFNVSRVTIYCNCTSGRYNYPVPSAEVIQAVKAVLKKFEIL